MLNVDKNHKVTPDPEALRIKAFKEIWDRDKSKDKNKALDIFAYIYFKYHPKSGYRHSNVGVELHKKILIDVIKNPSWKVPNYVKEAEKIYEDSMNTVGMKLLNSALTAAEGVASLFKDFNFDEIEEAKEQLELATKLLSGLKNVDDVVLRLMSAIKKVESEVLASNKNKKEINKFHIPKSRR